MGPIKFIAEAIYGESDSNLLERAVTWFIVMIVVVFDPLAVVLLIASQYTFNWYKDEKEESKEKLLNLEDGRKDSFVEESLTVEPEPEPEPVLKDDELIEQIVNNPKMLDNLEIQHVLDQDGDLRSRLDEYLDKKDVIKPQEDINPKKPKKGSWLAT